jgi:HNH endonuclease
MIDPKVIELVKARAGDYCEYCDGPAKESMAFHHRKLRSRGGEDTVANLVLVHHNCHNLKTRSIHLRPAEAERLGFMVNSWQDPTEVPLVRADGSIVLLLNDGTVKTLKEAE